MSAETITFDSLESAGQAIPVVGDNGVEETGANVEENNSIHENQEADADDTNVQVPEGMKRVYIDFTVQKPTKDDGVDEAETIAADEAIAEDAKKVKSASPNSRKVAATWAECKAQNKSTCPYHGAAFMRDQFNAIFEKFGFAGAEARVAPYGDDESPLPAYRLYFNVAKDFDKKQLQKAFDEMMKIPGVGELKVDDLVDKKYHTEPEDKELSYDIEEFDPNVDPNEEMKKDLEREKAEAEKKAAEEKAKKEAEEKAKAEAAKKAEEESKKNNESERKDAEENYLKAKDDLVGSSYAKYGVLEHTPFGADEQYEYVRDLIGNIPDIAVEDRLLEDAAGAYGEYVEQEKSLDAIEAKIASTNNPATKEVLSRLAKVSKKTLAEKERALNEAVGAVKEDVLDLCEDCRKHYEDTCDNIDAYIKDLSAQYAEAFGKLTKENQKAFQEKQKGLLEEIAKDKESFGKAHSLFSMYADKMNDAIGDRRWDKAAAILSDDDGIERARTGALKLGSKLKNIMGRGIVHAEEAVKAQEVAEQTKGRNADAAEVKELVDKLNGFSFISEEDKRAVAQALGRLPASFVKGLPKTRFDTVANVNKKFGEKVKTSYSMEVKGGSVVALNDNTLSIPKSVLHELGHAYLYAHGLSHSNPLFKNAKGNYTWKVPEHLREIANSMEAEGRDAMKRIFGNAKVGKTKANERTFDMMSKMSGMDEFKDDVKKGDQKQNVAFWVLADMFGCVNRGGFFGHSADTYRDEFASYHEMLADAISAMACDYGLIKKIFPKSLAKLRETIEANVVDFTFK